jgi:hypothetical protein
VHRHPIAWLGKISGALDRLQRCRLCTRIRIAAIDGYMQLNSISVVKYHLFTCRYYHESVSKHALFYPFGAEGQHLAVLHFELTVK